MDIKVRLSSVLIFEYAFTTLEAQMQAGVNSLATKEKLKAFLQNLPIENKESTIEELFSGIPVIKDNDKLMASQFIPMIVILSFANELAIKALIKQTKGIDQGGHKLKNLIEKLEAANKTSIKENVMAELAIDSAEYDKLLDDNSESFVSWRYFYEANQDSSLKFQKSLLTNIKNELDWN